MFGNRPMTTNSVMPMPKLPMARERSAHFAAPLDGVEGFTGSAYRSSDSSIAASRRSTLASSSPV
ncbi:Uncharacterised protein [Mycobacterium tuberculosis]|nr:Uncharacterised protein [Mycobacterium tuberculosis]